MAETRNYTIGKSRINKAFLQGFISRDAGRIELDAGNRHILYLTNINSMEKEYTWGRLHMNLVLEEQDVCVVRAFARDTRKGPGGLVLDDYLTKDGISEIEKREFMKQSGCISAINKQDILLYELTGQYLWISIEVIGEAAGYIDQICICNPGDNFMQTFPDIYQETGSFFHRYLSIYSSLYNSLGDVIAHRDKWLDFNTAPPELLYEYAQWLGLDVQGEFLEIPILRSLLKETYRLNRIKGTREAILCLVQIVMGEKAVIVERNLLESYILQEERGLYNSLYGSSEQDITILIPCKAEEKLQIQLEFLLKQFKPIRSRLRLVCYNDCNRMDSYCYLNHNARLYKIPDGNLDRGKELNASSLQS